MIYFLIIIATIIYITYVVYNYNRYQLSSNYHQQLDLARKVVKKRQYMQSQKWRLLSNYIKVRDKHQCQLCNSKQQLEVHHQTYENLFNEKEEDLITLCRNCHQQIHNKLGYDYSSTYYIKDYNANYNQQ